MTGSSRSHPRTPADPVASTKSAPTGRGQPQPAGRQHPQDVAVGHAERVPRGPPGPLDHPVHPAAHVGRPLAADHAVRPQRPPGTLGRDLGRGSPLVGAVVPLHEIRLGLPVETRPAHRCPLPAATDWSAPGRTSSRAEARRPLSPARGPGRSAGRPSGPCACRSSDHSVAPCLSSTIREVMRGRTPRAGSTRNSGSEHPHGMLGQPPVLYLRRLIAGCPGYEEE